MFQEEPSSEIVVAEDEPPRTKGDIVGSSDTDEDSISDDETSDQAKSRDDDSRIDVPTSDRECPDGEDEGPKDEIKLLPATVDGLGKRFRKLWNKFMREGNTHFGMWCVVTSRCYYKR